MKLYYKYLCDNAYQSANRLAHLYFFREIADIPTWLVNVYFANDPHSPTSAETWEMVLPEVKKELGFADRGIDYYIDLILEAGD